MEVKIRFPEFKEEWEEKELRELAELTKGKVFPNKKTEGPYYIMNGGKKAFTFFRRSV